MSNVTGGLPCFYGQLTVFDFADSRSGKNAREFLGFDDQRTERGRRGTLVCDDYSGYKAFFPKGATAAGF